VILNSEGMPCALLRLGVDGRILYSNRVFAQWLEISEAIAPGRMIDEYLARPARIFFHTHVLPHLHLHGSVEEMYLNLQMFSHGELQIVFNAVRHEDEVGAYFDCILVRMLRRVEQDREINQLQLALRESNEALEKANALLAALLTAQG
jgi:hypothetical protein